MNSNTLTISQRSIGAKSPGFTIVELLIVIVVIGILAAITIVAYNGVQNRARVSSVTSSLTQAAKRLAAFAVDGNGYPTTLASVSINDSAGVSYQYSFNNSANPATFCVTATNGNISYMVNSTNSTPSAGGCAGHGQGGVAAVTNIITNPSFETNTSIWTGGGDQGSPTITRVAGGPAGGFYVTLAKVAPVGSAQFNYVADNLTAGKTYTLGFWAWADTPGTANVQLARNNISFAPFINLTFSVTTTPTFFTGTGVAPVDSTQMRLRVTPKTDGTATHYDGFIVTEGTSMTSYADGNSANWVWTGTANLSTSTGPPQ